MEIRQKSTMIFGKLNALFINHKLFLWHKTDYDFLTEVLAHSQEISLCPSRNISRNIQDEIDIPTSFSVIIVLDYDKFAYSLIQNAETVFNNIH
jgi:hypothetical protein